MAGAGVAGPWPERITASYGHLLGRGLCTPEELYDLPAVVLCHDTSDDPVFVYANRAAQTLWERSWDDFIGWPSRLTAPPAEQASRAAALSADGVVRGYSGVRVSSTGRLFRIQEATVWTVRDEAGHVCGQAATFTRVSAVQAL